ncbi:MAG: ATP-binding protein [Kofleriaceae bacterium]|nr:ATP-binding protein [Kofleriaceae bacterium]
MTDTDRALESGQITAWLNATTRQLEQSLTGPRRAEVIADLRREAGAPRSIFRILASLALLDDCLRVAHLAIEADGVVEDDELVRTFPLARVAARSYFAALPRYEAFGDPDLSAAELRTFLTQHRGDALPFGNASALAWRGLRLCQRVAAHTGNDALVRDHERMLVQVMDAILDGRMSPAEDQARRQLRDLLDERRTGGVDPRVVAFCRPDGPEIFSSVAHGSQLFERDPLDVETIHADARAAFSRQLEHAITPVRHGEGHGRTLLVLGAAGSGKTHLLRAFRADVHEERLGYVGYLQMSSDVGDYARYVLAKLIDSLERPYDAPELEDSALMYLSTGLVEHDGAIPADELDRLRTGELEAAQLPGFVGRLVDRLVRTERLAQVDSDLVHALLLLQRRDPALQRRVMKFLRCEALTTYEQELLGGLSSRTRPEDPPRMLESLGRLAFELQNAALVLLVDQVEDAVPEDAGFERVQRAIDVLRRLADALPSCVVVIACLEDVYDVIRPRLTQAVVDRLERDPPPIRLTGRRSRDEIEAMLVRRLQHLYDALDAPWRPDEPIFPCSPADVEALANQRARDCLAFFRAFQERCIAEGTIVEPARSPEDRRPIVTTGGQDELDRAWNDAQVQAIDPPDDDRALLEVVARAVRACADETGLPAVAELDPGSARPRLRVAVPGRPFAPRVIEVCNRQAQGGRLGAQIDALRTGIPAGHVAVALRTSEFTFGPRAQITAQIGALIQSGGVKLVIDDAQLRTVLAFAGFAQAHAGHPGFEAWRAARRPIASLSALRTLLDLDNVPRVEARPRVPAPTVTSAPASPPGPSPSPAPAPAAAPPCSRSAPRSRRRSRAPRRAPSASASRRPCAPTSCPSISTRSPTRTWRSSAAPAAARRPSRWSSSSSCSSAASRPCWSTARAISPATPARRGGTRRRRTRSSPRASGRCEVASTSRCTRRASRPVGRCACR